MGPGSWDLRKEGTKEKTEAAGGFKEAESNHLDGNGFLLTIVFKKSLLNAVEQSLGFWCHLEEASRATRCPLAPFKTMQTLLTIQTRCSVHYCLTNASSRGAKTVLFGLTRSKHGGAHSFDFLALFLACLRCF